MPLARSCHPGPTVAVTLIAGLLGVGAGLPAERLALVVVTVLAGQLSIGWSNDWLDVERDAAAGRRDKPAASGAVSTAALRRAAWGALLLAVPLSLAAGWSAGAAHLLLVASGWVYNIWLKATVWSPLPFAVGFGSLPVYVSLVAGVRPAWWLPVAGAALGVAAHFANVAPDVDHDRAAGVWGAPQRIGARASLLVALLLLSVTTLVVLPQLDLQGPWGLAVAAVAGLPVVAGALLLLRCPVQWAFPMVVVAALVDVALLTMVT